MPLKNKRLFRGLLRICIGNSFPIFPLVANPQSGRCGLRVRSFQTAGKAVAVKKREDI